MKSDILPVICLMGPTAVGKSQVAISLSKILPCDIISVDSVMVYRQMNIGTSKPDPLTLSLVPHGLVDIRDPMEAYSAGDFFRDIQPLIQKSIKHHRIPLLVGGTMLYFNTLRQGLASLPNDREYSQSASLKREFSQLSLQTLYKKLQTYDPNIANRLHAHDRQRIERALLVYHLSKTPLSQLQAKTPPSFPYKTLWIGLYPENREILRKTIGARCEQMIADGFIEEAKALYDQLKNHPHLPAYRAIGYRQMWDYFEGKLNLDTLKSRISIATAQLAKRQLTWLRGWPEITPFYAHDTHLLSNLKKHIQECIPFN